jgi:hypothetical protein
MTWEGGAVPVMYDDLEDGDARLDPAIVAGGLQQASYRGGTALMLAPAPASTPVLRGPAARFVAANTPNRIQIRVSPPQRRARVAPPTFEWAVAVGAGLLSAVVIGAVAALI